MCKSYICSLNLYVFLNVFAVEAYAASWIEIMLLPFAYKANWSRLTQPRGLKFLFHAIVSNLTPSRLTQPRGLKLLGKAQIKWTKPSRLTQPRGLKLSCPVTVSMRYWVEAYAASWIEMINVRPVQTVMECRGLRSLVD